MAKVINLSIADLLERGFIRDLDLDSEVMFDARDDVVVILNTGGEFPDRRWIETVEYDHEDDEYRLYDGYTQESLFSGKLTDMVTVSIFTQ